MRKIQWDDRVTLSSRDHRLLRRGRLIREGMPHSAETEQEENKNDSERLAHDDHVY